MRCFPPSEWANLCTTTDTGEQARVPDGLVLEQNYPNPFHPTTAIAYYVPQQSDVTLEVFDMTGRAVATLVDHVESPGKQTITFDGSDLASGVYFYRLRTASGLLQSKMMVLVKP